MKTIHNKQMVRAFFTMITNNNRPKRIGTSREQKLVEISKNYAQVKADVLTVQRLSLKLLLRKVQNDH